MKEERREGGRGMRAGKEKRNEEEGRREESYD